MTTNITDYHREVFNALTSGQYDNFALVSTTFDGQPTAAIAAVNEDDDGYRIRPVAVLLTDDMFDRLTDPSEGMDT